MWRFTLSAHGLLNSTARDLERTLRARRKLSP